MSTVASDSASMAESDYPTGRRLFYASLGICLTIFLAAMDNTIITTAIPKITDEFNNQSDIGWYGSAYLLTQCCVQLPFGKLYSVFPIKIVLLCAIAIFEIGSTLCGAAWSSTALIVGRAVAGIGSAGIASGAIICIAHIVPVARRPLYTGIISAMYGIASVVGPILGGVFTSHATWRWCFFINLPIGAVAASVLIFLFTPPENPNIPQKKISRETLGLLDLPGALTLAPAITGLLLAVNFGGNTFPWSSWQVILLFVVSGLCSCVWAVIQVRKGDKATVPVRLFKNRSVAAAAWFSFTLSPCFLVLVYYLPVWFQAVQAASPLQSGLMSLPLLLGLTLVSLLTGLMVSATGYYAPAMILSSILAAIGCGLMSSMKVDAAPPQWAGFQSLASIGIGLGLQQPPIVAQSSLPLSDIPTGASIMYFVQALGAALFLLVSQSVFSSELVKNLQAADINLDGQDILHSGATSFAQHLDPQNASQALEAYNAALCRTFLIAALLAALSLFGALGVKWVNVRSHSVPRAAKA